MKNSPVLLKEKIRFLEEKLKTKDKLLKKYRQSLQDSNTRIKKIAKDLEGSLSLVRDIHRHLLPVRLPHIPGFEFSYKFVPTRQGVSGDFFDIVKMEQSMKFSVLLSSCSTYALSSLFLSAFLKFSPKLKSHKSAKDFLLFVADKVSSSLSKKEKIHLFYGVISRSSFELDYCLVGDIFAGYKAFKKDFCVLPSSAPHLARLDKSQIKSGKIILNPSDLLLLCSPGLSSRKNPLGQNFGRDKIIKTASQKPQAGVLELRQNVLFSCNQFAKEEPAQKDCSILAIKALPNTLRLHNS